MTQPEQDKDQPKLLSQQIEHHRKEVQFLVKQGGEQPEYEFKRSVALARENLDERLEFIKFVQAVANAEIFAERCIVVGADPYQKKFHPITNASEFDAANLSKLFSAYLSPVPRFQVFNVTTDENEPFILIVLDANQPRPIVVIKQGQTTTGKTRLEVGEIWIKRNTDTVRAMRTDLDSMYSVRSESEAEDRARKRLKHLLEVTAGTQSPQVSSSIVPTFELLVGPRNVLQKFSTELIASGDLRRLRMLVELGRETLVEGWDKIGTGSPVLPVDATLFSGALSDFYRDEFLPALESSVELGLLLVKHDTDQVWLESVIELLMEAFEASRILTQMQLRSLIPNASTVAWWRPSFDVYIGIRTIATYAVRRNRLQLLGTILPRMAYRISSDIYSQAKTPVLFWPFWGVSFEPDELKDGRASFYWKQRIGTAWGKYFGSFFKFLESSSQLEFLLYFNSYLATNEIDDPKLSEWLKHHVDPDVTFRFLPDLYAESLQSTLPMADRIYDVLTSAQSLPSFMSVDPRIPPQIFADLSTAKRLEIYAGFLNHLKAWQSTFRYHNFSRFGFMWDWDSPRLKKIVEDFRAKQKSN